jgi:chemotaxis family two-component system sensor kinase Cph1
MKDTGAPSSEDELLRLAECVREPLRRPGAVQPHGVLLVLDGHCRTVLEVSESVVAVLGLAVDDVLDRPLTELVDEPTAAALRSVADHEPGASNPVAAWIGGRDFDAIVHRSGDEVVVELEPAPTATDRATTPAIFAAVHRLARMTTPEEVWAATAVTVRQLTGFDRVMVYHFHDDGHGQVVAEQAHPDMEPYLGLHYPASDIPAQARELYLTKLSRAIVSSAENGSALVRTAGPGADADSDATPSPVDLSQAELRSVSPHHLQFMRNMGQASTLSFSLIHEGVLIGMITCAHRTPHRVEYLIRQGLEVLAAQVALQVSSMAEIERLRTEARFRDIRARLVARLEDGRSMAEALLGGDTTLLTLVPADGVVVVVDGAASSLGWVPDDAGLLRASAAFAELSPGRILTSEALAEDAPALAALLPETAGLVVVPLGAGDDFIAWFRREVAQSVEWLGDMAASNRATPLSPRNSFSSWTQSVSGRSLPWGGLEREARELSRDFDGYLLQRAESKLADLAVTDALTGLPNRRLLLDRLEHSLTKYARGEEVSLLFLDIDGFKGVNDEYGHDAGDLLLVHVATQLRAATREQDTVARLGGDEFVVLCENTTAEEADVVAGRILAALRTPVDLAGTSVAITASIGVAAANFTLGAADLLRQADEAMYRAKKRGRDRIAR